MYGVATRATSAATASNTFRHRKILKSMVVWSRFVGSRFEKFAEASDFQAEHEASIPFIRSNVFEQRNRVN
jgi:hypothetical protein